VSALNRRATVSSRRLPIRAGSWTSRAERSYRPQ
jgi:hypothetical protein